MRKDMGENEVNNTQNFEDYKMLAKKYTLDKPCHLLPYFQNKSSKLFIYDVNSRSFVKHSKLEGIEKFGNNPVVDWAFISQNTLIALGLTSLWEVYSIDINKLSAKRIGDICEPKTYIATCAHRRKLYTFGGETIAPSSTNSSEVLTNGSWT